MITKITLINFKCYEQHEIPFNKLTIIVGKNNAGKSTLIEALRIISIVSKRFTSSNFNQPPNWTNLPKRYIGIHPSLGKIDFSTHNIINQFGESPARIKVDFENGELIEIFIKESGELFAYAKNEKGHYIKTKSSAKDLEQASISILPQIGPLLEEEKVLDPSYVHYRLHSNLVSRHFRNQLSYYPEFRDQFIKLAEGTWPGLRIVDLIEASKGFNPVDPSLIVQEGTFATEIGSMGHGLQMWLQTMWFLARTPSNHSVVLDEPDVYMHADLQRKLIRILKGKFHQIIIATHSLEIMAEVLPENMIIIDRRQQTSKFAVDLPNIQSVIYNDIGSIHNLELARIWSARKFLMVEGSDISILKRFQDTLYPDSLYPFDNIPNSDIGGWGGWKYAIGSKYVLRNAGDELLKIYCILDSDYHIPPEIDEKKAEAARHKINLHIWKRKEIENYLLVPEAICRLIIRKKPNLRTAINVSIICEKIYELAENTKDDIIDNYATEIAKYYRMENLLIDFTNEGNELKYEAKNFNKIARSYVKSRWENRIEVIPGKDILRALNRWLTEDHKVSFGIAELATEIKENELSEELKSIIHQLENN